MKTDFYTKFMLTIIAVCLILLTLQTIDIFPKAYAGSLNTAPLEKANYALVPVNPDGSINVNIKNNTPMNVNVTKISTSDDLDVNVVEIGGTSVYGAIPVKNK